MFLLLYFDVTGCLFVPTDVESSLKKKKRVCRGVFSPLMLSTRLMISSGRFQGNKVCGKNSKSYSKKKPTVVHQYYF